MINIDIWNYTLTLNTDESLFSPNHADKGTLTMLNYVNLNPDEEVLDLGCGYGIVGIAIAKVIGDKHVYMVDCNELAVRLARENALKNEVSNVKIECGNGLDAFKDKIFSLILSNPPYHTDFSIAKQFIEKGYRQLKIGGKFILVVKRLIWYKNKLKSIFGGVKVFEDSGYYILISEKRPKINQPIIKTTTKKHLKKLSKKHKT